MTPLVPGDPDYNESTVVSGFNQGEVMGWHSQNTKERMAQYYTPNLMADGEGEEGLCYGFCNL